MLIGQEGEKLGLVDFKDALEQAQQSELDLVPSFTIWFRSSSMQANGLWETFIYKEKKYFFIKGKD